MDLNSEMPEMETAVDTNVGAEVSMEQQSKDFGHQVLRLEPFLLQILHREFALLRGFLNALLFNGLLHRAGFIGWLGGRCSP